MSSGIAVCCVKWGTKYPPHYVNRLRNMVRRHLAVPHDFVCLTEDPAGLDPDIGIVPVPPGLTGYWNKISLFRDDLFEPGRTLVYLDVDVVVIGPLDFLLKGRGLFTVSHTLGQKGGYNSSVMRIVAGALPQVNDRFRARADEIFASGRYVGDQDWIFEQVPSADFFEEGRIVSYKKDLRSHAYPLARKLRIAPAWLKAPRWMTVAPPPGASIVVFHGKPDPADVADAPYGVWKRAPFVKEHWR